MAALTPYWKATGAAGPWRKAATDPPPANPTVVAWLERRTGESESAYVQRAELGALPSFHGPQTP